MAAIPQLVELSVHSSASMIQALDRLASMLGFKKVREYKYRGSLAVVFQWAGLRLFVRTREHCNGR